MKKVTVPFAIGFLLLAGKVVAAAEVELVDCRLTPEAKKELQLTAEQGPKVEKAFADVMAITEQIGKNRTKRDELRKAGATPEAIDPVSKQIVAGERQCMDKLHPVLKTILTEAQFNKVLAMEAAHEKNRAAANPQRPPASR